jgi:predicted ferric reductase
MFPTTLSLITIIFWLLSKPNLNSIIGNPLLSLSQIISLIGTVLLSFTFILSSRFKLPEKIFGNLGVIYKNHHLYGAISFLMLISHPLLLALNAFQNFLPSTIYLLPSSNFIYSAGVLSLYSLIILLIFTLLIKLPYPLWLKTHRLMGFVLIFALIHTSFITSDISRFIILKIWIIFWLIAALASSIYVRFIYPKKIKTI